MTLYNGESVTDSQGRKWDCNLESRNNSTARYINLLRGDILESNFQCIFENSIGDELYADPTVEVPLPSKTIDEILRELASDLNGY
jgi:hypothetical protein